MSTDISYQNDAVFMGRFDSITLNILPSIGHYDACGFFADASLSYHEIDENRIDLFLLTAGFDLIN
jgi:hypothetical protein